MSSKGAGVTGTFNAGVLSAMKVLLISANTEQVNMPVMPLGMACIKQAALAAGHSVRALNLMTPETAEKQVMEAIESHEPEVIGISVRNIDDQSIKNSRFLLDSVKPVMALCRRLSGAPIVLGGAGYSIFPRQVLDYLEADMGIQGEGEGVFVSILPYLRRGETIPDMPGLYFANGRRGPVPAPSKKLDDYPLPDPDPVPAGYDHERIWMPIQTRRGCPMGCSYCSTPSIEGTRLRKRSPGEVLRALRRYVDAGIQQFYFVDNTFNLPVSYAEAICDAIIDAGTRIRWQAIVYPNFMGRVLAEKMARAGCVQISLGFESGDETILKRMNKRTDPGTIFRISELFRVCGIRRMGFLLLGGPGETRASVERSLDFVDRLHPEMMRLTLGMRIYPRTELSRIAVQEGVISSEDTLLTPRFYMRDELASWLPDVAARAAASHPNWII